MLKSGVLPVATALVGVGVFVLATQVRAGGDLVKFPEHSTRACCSRRSTAPTTSSTARSTPSQAALDAAKKGEPLPDGTVITLVQYRAKLGADGNPEKDANGRFIKGDLLAYTVMEKRKGWGTEYPDTHPQRRVGISGVHVGPRQVNTKAKLEACFQCHKPLPSGQDFVFLYNKMAGK